MTVYNAKNLAASFRTVRGNTIIVAEEIPEEKYGFRATPETRSVGEMLAHIAVSTDWSQHLHGNRKKSVSFEEFTTYMQQAEAAQNELKTKSQILDALRESGDRYARFLDGLSDEVIEEHVSFPAPVDPPSKSRFEMLLSVKEHEMHHRAQLMLVERLLGMVPHLTRRYQEQMAAAQSTAKS
jgi:uncharacterized damage-inducible protein DinB